MVRVKPVDFGITRTAAISDIALLDKNFIAFPRQSINLCLFNLIPWNSHAWNDFDGKYATTLLNEKSGHSQSRYEIRVQYEMQADCIFTSNLCSSEMDYAQTIISKGIAHSFTSEDFLRCVKTLH